MWNSYLLQQLGRWPGRRAGAALLLLLGVKFSSTATASSCLAVGCGLDLVAGGSVAGAGIASG